MKLSYNWLKEYINIDYPPEELAAKLTAAGIEVEEIITNIPDFSGVVVGKVLETKKHENADKLSVCQVTDGKDTYQVICGAPNVAAGQTVPFARTGAVLVGEFKIKKAKIRGVESYGMICSKEELGLEKSSAGIWSLENIDCELGTDFHEYLTREQDYIFDLAITPNRPDCLSITGIARELSAITSRNLHMPDIQCEESERSKAPEKVKIHIETQEGCPRYAARLIENVKVGKSPEWLKKRLESVGIRSINTIVDITNYVLMELGHPLHAFDLAEIRGNTIIVRDSKPAETFITLDEKSRTLPDKTVMICDADRPVAVGGIMGGLNSEVSENTNDVLLEAAYFKRERIAESSKKLGLSTEASQRFERGADPEGVIRALDRAAALMVQFSGGEIAEGIIDVYPNKQSRPDVPFRSERVNHVLGTSLPENQMKSILERLGFSIAENKASVPSFRVDVHQEIDLIEEIARLVGYDNLPTRTFTRFPYERAGGTENDQLLSHFREKMIELGLKEVLTNSMIRKDESKLFYVEDPVALVNPISDDMTVMRRGLIPGLMRSVSFNLNRNNHDLRFFEIGRVFASDKAKEFPDQPYRVAGVLCGRRYRASWEKRTETVDFYDLKGLLETLIEKIFLDKIKFILYDNHEYLEPEEAMRVLVDSQEIGHFGKIKKTILDRFDIEVPVYVFELVLNPLLQSLEERRHYEPVPKFPYVEKDMALVVDESVLSEEIRNYIIKIGGPLLKNVEVFDVFRGEKLPKGKKSVAFRMRFQSPQRTLSDDEVDEIFEKVIRKSEHTFKASLRDA